MRTERILFSKGINRALDPRFIGADEQYDAYNLEVIERGTLSKRKGFGRWSEDAMALFTTPVRGLFVMYDREGARYLFTPFDQDEPGTKTDLSVEKDGVFLEDIENFFPSKGYRVRAAVFGDKIFFVNGVDRPRWYKEGDLTGHIWGIAGVPTPARRAIDESVYNYFLSQAFYAECITSAESFGIESPGIWRYKQAIGYYGEEDDTQIEESNAGPASKMFHCQFSTAEAPGTTLQGYIKKGIAIGIADFDDLILDAGEAGGQDYENFIRWMRLYRQWKMFSDEFYSPFEHLVEMRKGWPTSVQDLYQRDSAVVTPTTRVSLPVAHHVEKVNNRLFLGRVEKELFTQPGLPKDFRGETAYKPNFSHRMPVTITNTGGKTLTSAAISLRFQDHDDTNHTATPPSGGGDWDGAYINTSLDLNGATDWYQMIFVDEDGVTPLGFFKIAVNSSGTDDITFLVEIPEIAAGGSRTIYLYFEDSQLNLDPESYAGQPGHWRSLAHYPLCASDHILLMDFENWKSGLQPSEVTQKRVQGFIIDDETGYDQGTVTRQTGCNIPFFGDSSKYISGDLYARIYAEGSDNNQAALIPIKLASASADEFTFAFLAMIRGGEGTDIEDSVAIYCRNVALPPAYGIRVNFRHYPDPNTGNTHRATVTAYNTDGTQFSCYIESTGDTAGQVCHNSNDDWLYYLVSVTATTLSISAVYAKGTGHPGEYSSWDDSQDYIKYTASTSFSGKLGLPNTGDGLHFRGAIQGRTEESLPAPNYMRFKEIQAMTRATEGGQDALVHMINRDTYFPNYGLAIAEDRESATGEKYPDRFFFSQLNQPNSFEALNFRDLGDRGEIIQGIKGIHNRVFIFTEREIRALFSAGAEQALTLASGDTTMWNLSQDLTGQIGGLGVLAADSLVNMEFAGRDGIGFLSKRGFYFFDGQSFVHISEKIDNLIYDEDVSDDYRRNMTAHFLGRKRQLIFGVLGWHTPIDYEYWMLVASMKFAQDPAGMIWSRWSNLIKYGVELDFNIDTGQFVYANTPDDVHSTRQILKLEGNTGANTYKDISYDVQSGMPVTALTMSKQFDVFDSELIKGDLHTSGDLGYEVDLTVFKDNLISGSPTVANVTNGMYFFPIGTHAKLLLFQLFENSAFRTVFEKLDFYYNRHGHRRL